jgi:uncharacterized MAPEG superfamily protein
MTTELTMLVWCVILMLLLPYVYVGDLLRTPNGLAWGTGNRERPLTGESAWASRARRAHANTLENLVPFAALVLVAHVAGRTNDMTALGAQVFFWARLAYVVVYIAGLVPWRTVAFGVGFIGQVLVLLPLLR